MLIRAAALMALVLFAGCGTLRPGIRGSGISQSQIRSVEDFHEIKLSGFGTVNVYAGDWPTVRVTTDDNLLAHVETQVENGKLKIRPGRPINPGTGLTVDVFVPYLAAARVSGAGDMNIIDVVGDQLDLTISGAGTLTANGYARDVSMTISGAGDADLRELRAENADIRISGAGDATVFASQSVRARISGAGNVVCYGNPAQVDQRVSGAGDLKIRKDDAPVEYIIGDVR